MKLNLFFKRKCLASVSSISNFILILSQKIRQMNKHYISERSFITKIAKILYKNISYFFHQILHVKLVSQNKQKINLLIIVGNLFIWPHDKYMIFLVSENHRDREIRQWKFFNLHHPVLLLL